MIEDPSKVHADETNINSNIVCSLLKEQFPEWLNLSLKLIKSQGTDNVMYQLGDDKVIRLPRTYGSALSLQKECDWLPKLAPKLPIPVPVPIARGIPSTYYPHPWAICQFLEGSNPCIENRLDLQQASKDMAHFIDMMQKIPVKSGPECRRGLPLDSRAQETRDAIQNVTEMYDAKLLNEIWDSMLAVPSWHGSPVWIHGDLHAGNLLAKNNLITAVLDFGSAGVGDPACDLMVAWTLLDTDSRKQFQEIIQYDDATWQRGRGWAFTMGLVAYPYYKETDPLLASIAKRALDEVVTEFS